MKQQISNGVITLKKYEMEFAPLLYEAARESYGGEFTRWMPWCHENYSIEDSKLFIAKTLKGWKQKNQYSFAIFDAHNNEFLGGIGLNQFGLHKLVNLGYWVRTSRHNRGIATQATRILTKACYEDLDINRIEIVVAVENIASQKAAEKSGAIREGILRERLIIHQNFHDAVMFSFIRADFD